MLIAISIIAVLLIPLAFRWVIGVDYKDEEETKDKPLK